MNKTAENTQTNKTVENAHKFALYLTFSFPIIVRLIALVFPKKEEITEIIVTLAFAAPLVLLLKSIHEIKEEEGLIEERLGKISENVEKNSKLLYGKLSDQFPQCVKDYHCEFSSFIIKGIEENRIEPGNRFESMAVFLKLVEFTSEKYVAVNFFSGRKPTLLGDKLKQEVYDASMRLVGTGKIVKRYFLLYDPETYIENEYEEPERIIHAMEMQSKSGIYCFYGLVSNVKSIVSSLPRSFANMALIDDRVHISSTRDDSDDNHNSFLDIMNYKWNISSSDTNFIKQLENLEGGVLKRFETRNDEEIVRWLEACDNK